MTESGTRLKVVRRPPRERVGPFAVVSSDSELCASLRGRAAELGLDAVWIRGQEESALSGLGPVMVVDRADADAMPGWLRESLRERPEGRLAVVVLEPRTEIFLFGRHELSALLDRVQSALLTRATDLSGVLLGRSAVMADVREQIRQVAPFRDVNVIVMGETGTGKELVAHGIHLLGPSDDGRLVALNCAAVPDNLFEAELFGHVAGAYTGARDGRTGLLEEAAGGTMFFDEVGEMPAPLQSKMLRALETRRFRPVGSNEERPMAARVVSASNRSLRDGHTLRSDLYYRLAGFTIVLPPLRHRIEDVADLAPRFLAEFCLRHGMRTSGFAGSALQALMEHRWPGNVRELKAVVEHLAIVAGGRPIDGDTVRGSLRTHGGRPATRTSRPPRAEPASVAPPALMRPPRATPTELLRGRALRDVERDIIERTLERNEGNVAQTARELGIPRSTLRAKLRRYADEG